MLSSGGHWNGRPIMQVKTESANHKPWLEESTLSSQSAADSTGRDEVREKSISTITEW